MGTCRACRGSIRKAKKGDIISFEIDGFYFIDKIEDKKEITPTYENLKPKLKKILAGIYVNKLMNKMYEEGK